MSTPVQVSTQPAAPVTARSANMAMLVLIAGWLVPGAGHFLLRKPIRGLLLLLSICGMFAVGVMLGGKIASPTTGDLLDILAFVGQLGAGVLYFLAKVAGLGTAPVLTAVGDYGSKFIVCAGLLNVIAAVDAHSLANGRKAS